jgi:superfamily II DNA helicase RecQ
MTTSNITTHDVNPPALDGSRTSFGAAIPVSDASLVDVLQRVWGYSGFRPLQREAMHAILQSRDSVVVLPTGGGKSLCFQAPARRWRCGRVLEQHAAATRA